MREGEGGREGEKEGGRTHARTREGRGGGRERKHDLSAISLTECVRVRVCLCTYVCICVNVCASSLSCLLCVHMESRVGENAAYCQILRHTATRN